MKLSALGLPFCHRKGDYYRYQAEFSEGDRRDSSKNKASECYEAALAVGKTLHNYTTSPIYLGLALNFSVFQYEILHKPEDAIKTAQAAYEGAIADDAEQSEQSKDSPMIIQVMRIAAFITLLDPFLIPCSSCEKI